MVASQSDPAPNRVAESGPIDPNRGFKLSAGQIAWILTTVVVLAGGYYAQLTALRAQIETSIKDVKAELQPQITQLQRDVADIRANMVTTNDLKAVSNDIKALSNELKQTQRDGSDIRASVARIEGLLAPRAPRP